MRRTIWLALFALLTLPWAAASAQGINPAQFDAYLQAGEFGLARQVAAQAATPQERNAYLSRIARAQSRAGAGRGAVNTAGAINDDVMRAGTVGQMSGSQMSGAPGLGGGPQADFDSLIDLIKATVAKDSWDGSGADVMPFPSGVFVDGSGVLRQVISTTAAGDLASLRSNASKIGENRQARQEAPIRKISLNRLEKEIQLLWAQGRQPDEAMKNLAGLRKITHVFVYPETGDIVLAGPAGDWKANNDGRAVSTADGSPVLQLDDLVVVLRGVYSGDGRFGCSIDPTQAGLSRTQDFLNASKSPLPEGGAAGWTKKLRETLGKQDISVFGIDPRTHAANVIVEADYHMKLIGMGLQEGVAGVPSYLSLVKLDKDGKLPPMNVLRWWFTLNYQSVLATEGKNAFELKGTGVKVLSENEFLGKQGQRVHTGKSDEWTAAFADSFTQHFGLLSKKYPVYAQMRNVFDLALVAALLKEYDLPNQSGWHMTHFGDPERYQVERYAAPQQVESVVNHRVIGQSRIVAGVSGGVKVDTKGLASSENVKIDTYGKLKADHSAQAPSKLPKNAWWWD